MTKPLSLKVLVSAAAGELKISTREEGLMVCQGTMAGNSITSCGDTGLLSATFRSGGGCTSMPDPSVLLPSAAECFPHGQDTIIDSPH